MNQSEYWDARFSDPNGVRHHHAQNYQISRDFLEAATRAKGPIFRALASRLIIEIGCGNGAFAAMLASAQHPAMYYATDLSLAAIRDAQQRNPASSVRFETFDILNDWPTPLGNFDLAIASNVLEHFKNPWLVLDRMLQLAGQALVLVPYRQSVTDGYDGEGGAGHVYTFTKGSFKDYGVRQAMLFESKGWQHRSRREKPRQLAVLVG